MMSRLHALGLAAGILMSAAFSCLAQETPPGPELTLKGALQCNAMCIPQEPKTEDHVIVMVAVDGSPEVAAKVKKVMDEFYPDAGLDADAAQKLDEQFGIQLKYFIAPDSPAKMPADMPAPGPRHYCHCAAAYAVIGIVYEKDGKKWIKASSYQALGLKGLNYPEKMLRPDKPFVMPDKEPLVIKINDTIALNCIKMPSGKLLMDEPMYVAVRYVEQVPHMVTLTKPVYISEIPITQEIWEAVMGANPSKAKGAKLPVESPSFADIKKFCQILSEKTGRTVRMPTAAEWQYMARVGTSNPGFPDKYRDQGLFREEGGKVPLPVKSKKPNAWGFYDLFTPWWEMTNDRESYPPRHPETDPNFPPTGKGMHVLFGIAGENWTINEREFEVNSGYASRKFRIAVEVEPAAAKTP
jgi:formylglycine-generating enzyme required for sulfatase activity